MYLRLLLKNWRSIKEATVELAPFTVIVGKNSSGKSNLVDALLFSSEVARDAETAVRRRGGIASIRRWGPSRPYDVTVDWRVARSRQGLENTYAEHKFVLRSGKDGSWRFHKEEITFVIQGKLRTLYERAQNQFSMNGQSLKIFADERSNSSVVGGDIADTTSAMLFARQLSPPRLIPGLPAVRALRPAPEVMRQPQPPSDSPRLSDKGENIATALHHMTEPQRREVVRAMQRIIPGLADVWGRPAGRYLTLVFKQAHRADRQAEFEATEMSDGALRALAVVVAAQQMQRNELLVIEEPEVSLHPGAADVVYDVLHRASSQGAVLITTHSPEILDRAKDDEILVCEYVEGVTKIGPLAEAQRALVRQGLFSAAELMRSEELRREGAPPRVVQDA